MIPYVCFFLVTIACSNGGIIAKNNTEWKIDFIIDVISSRIDHKGWTNLITMGKLRDKFYKETHNMHFTFVVANDDYDAYEVDEILQYRANTVIVSCNNVEDFETKFNNLRYIPYWHPSSRIIVYYHGELSNSIMAKMFFYLWYFMCPNAIIIQFDDSVEKLRVTQYSPYISKHFELDLNFGCWTFKKITFPIDNFKDSFVCTEECHNVTVHSYLREYHLGTCIGLRSHIIEYGDKEFLKGINLFEDKGKNLHGFPIRAYLKEVMPFIKIKEHDNGTYTIHERDGYMWNEMSALMNFTIDITPSIKYMKKPFDFTMVVQMVYDFSKRKVDAFLMPIYLFDLVIVDVDMSTPFKESGVCFVSHRAGFETALFDLKLLRKNYDLFIMGIFCFIGTWFVFFIFNVVENNTITFDQAGKDFVNAIRNMLSISLLKPPRKLSFRIFLCISIWSFFVLNFATQAAIISFFSAHKRGKEVETFEDIIEKGYIVEGLASPDVMLPETSDMFRKINSKLHPIQDIFGCVHQLHNDNERFCLVDCSVGRYLQRNLLNVKGEQYLHIAKDQVHNHYLTIVLQKNSPLTDEFNKYMLRFIQAGLINKWEEYRYTDMKAEVPIKSLSMDDLLGVFKCYGLLLGLSIVTFLIEVTVYGTGRAKRYLTLKYARWRRKRAAKKKAKIDRKLRKIKLVSNSTQNNYLKLLRYCLLKLLRYCLLLLAVYYVWVRPIFT